jgi:hypothetical protein
VTATELAFIGDAPVVGGGAPRAIVHEHSVTRHIMIKHAAPDPHEGFRPA